MGASCGMCARVSRTFHSKPNFLNTSPCIFQVQADATVQTQLESSFLVVVMLGILRRAAINRVYLVVVWEKQQVPLPTTSSAY